MASSLIERTLGVIAGTWARVGTNGGPERRNGDGAQPVVISTSSAAR